MENIRELIKYSGFLGGSAGSGGTGGGADLLNADGVIKQEHLPGGYPYASVTQGSALDYVSYYVDEESGMAPLNSTAKIIIGLEYTVTWNGTEYVCVALDSATVDQPGGTVLGNVGAITGENVTDEPFVLLVPPADSELAMAGISVLVVALDGSTNGYLYIEGPVPTYTPIRREYLPQNLGVVFVDVELEDPGSYTSARVMSQSHNFSELRALVKANTWLVARVTSPVHTKPVYLPFQDIREDDGVIQFERLTSDLGIGSFSSNSLLIYSEESEGNSSWAYTTFRAARVNS